VAQLGDQPHSGYRTDYPDVRVMFVVRYPYKIFYRVRETVVEILHIRHTSRRAQD
jgi:toxin ParE1/3/4